MGAGRPDKPSWSERARQAFLEPAPPGRPEGRAPLPQTVEELERANRSADDQERLLGVIAAPLAALIGFIVLGNVPSSVISSGHVSLYRELTGVLLGLSVVILAMALARKRLLLGVVLALYGLDLFNLRYWGFGIPFLLGGGWLLTRAFRFQRALRDARGDFRPDRHPGGPARPAGGGRYTPPSTRPSGRSDPRQGRRRRGAA